MIEGNHAIPSRAITVRQWLDLGRLVTHNARVHQMRRETADRRHLAECRRPIVYGGPITEKTDQELRDAIDLAELSKIK